MAWLVVCAMICLPGISPNLQAIELEVEREIPVANPSFEDPGHGPGGFSGMIPDWIDGDGGGNQAGTFHPTATRYPLGLSDGNNVGFSNGPTIRQIVSEILIAGNMYTLFVDVGDRNDTGFPGFDVQLRANGTVLAGVDETSVFVPNGGFGTAMVTFTVPPGHAQLGQPLEIFLDSDGGQTNFDNVRLFVVSQLVATDGFESYPAGDLDGQNGGNGFGGAWDNSGTANVVSETLSYRGGTVQVFGGCQAIEATPGGSVTGGFLSRPLPATESGTLYLSFLYHNSVNDEATGGNDFVQLGFDNAAGDNPNASALDRNDMFQVRANTSAGNSNGAVPSVRERTYFLVMRVEKTGVNHPSNYDRVTLWVDPESDVEAAEIVDGQSSANAGISTLAHLVMRTAFWEAGDTIQVDEIRVGRTFADVVPTAAIAEPVIICPPSADIGCGPAPEAYTTVADFVAGGGTVIGGLDCDTLVSMDAVTYDNCQATLTRTYQLTNVAYTVECQQVFVYDVAPSTLRLEAEADTYVRRGDNDANTDANFGTSGRLVIKNSAGGTTTRLAIMRFDLRQVTPEMLDHVALDLHLELYNNGDLPDTQPVNFWGVADGDPLENFQEDDPNGLDYHSFPGDDTDADNIDLNSPVWYRSPGSPVATRLGSLVFGAECGNPCNPARLMTLETEELRAFLLSNLGGVAAIVLTRQGSANGNRNTGFSARTRDNGTNPGPTLRFEAPSTYICPPDEELGCLYGTNIFSTMHFAGPEARCPNGVVTTEDSTTQAGCRYQVQRVWRVFESCSTNAPDPDFECTNYYTYTIDREPPKVTRIHQGGSLGCLHDISYASVTSYVAQAAPVAFDMGSIEVLDDCCSDSSRERLTIGFQEGVVPTPGYVADSIYIRADQANSNADGDGDLENIIGRVGNNALRGLYAFDLSAIAAQDPCGNAEIESVTFTQTTRSRDGGSGQGGAVMADLLLYGFDFDESLATWNAPAPGDGTPGGTLGSVIASVTLDPSVAGGTAVTISSPGLNAAVSAALSQPDQTLRMMLKLQTETGGGNNFISFRNEDFTTLAQRPRLDITFNRDPGACQSCPSIQREHWCDTYYTNGCEVAMDRKIRVWDECGNTTIETIRYTINDFETFITGVETGTYLGCQDAGFSPPVRWDLVTLSSTQALRGVVSESTSFAGAGGVVRVPPDASPAAVANVVETIDPTDAPHFNDVDLARGDVPLDAFRTMISTAFANGSGGVLNFEDTSQNAGNDPVLILGNGVTMTIPNNTGQGGRGTGTGTDGREPVSGDGRLNGPRYQLDFANLTLAGTNECLQCSGVTAIGFTVVDRDNNNFTAVEVTYSDGSVRNETHIPTSANTEEDVFFSFVAPPGEHITFVDIDPNQWTFLDDFAFITDCDPLAALPSTCGRETDGALGSCTHVPVSYTVQVTSACTDLLSWGMLSAHQVYPNGGNIDFECFTTGGASLGSFNAPAGLVDLSGVVPAGETAFDLVITITSLTGDFCDSPLLESWAVSYNCVPEDPTNQMSVSEYTYKNDETCEVSLNRTFTYTGCCDEVVSRSVIYTYTENPSVDVGPLAKLDLGCIASTNQIPPLDLTMVEATSDCAIVSIRKSNQTAAVLTDGCTWSFDRVFVVETLCGVTDVVTQAVCYVLNNSQPELLSVPHGSNFACQAADFVPPFDSNSLAVSIHGDLWAGNIPPDPRFGWLGENYAGGNWASSFGADALVDFGGGTPTQETITDPAAILFLNSDRAVQLNGGAFNNNFAKTGNPDGDQVSGDRDVTIELCFSPDNFPATSPEVLFEEGNTTGIAILLDGNDLVLFFSQTGTSQTLTRIDLAALGFSAGKYVCARIKIARRPSSNSKDVEFTVTTQDGQTQTVEFNDPEDRWAGNNAGGLGRGNTSQIGDQFTGQVRFSGRIARLMFYETTDVAFAPAVTMTETRMTNDCEVMVLREFRVTDCCGNFDRREVVHTFTLQPDALTQPMLATMNLGCIGSLDAIPAPSSLVFPTNNEAQANVLLFDSFDDGVVASGGVNGGFVNVRNMGAAGPLTEAGGQISHTTANVNNQNSGIYSANSLNLAAQTSFTVCFDVASVNANPQNNGLYLGITDDNNTFYRSSGQDFGFRFNSSRNDGASTVELVHDDNGNNPPQAQAELGTYVPADFLDGFVACFTVNSDNTYSWEITGLPLSGGAGTSGNGTLSGITYASQFDNADNVIASIQRSNANRSFTLNEVSVTSAVDAPSGPTACSLVDIDWIEDRLLGTEGCASSNERVYEVTDLCGDSLLVTQLITFTLDQVVPRIAAVAPYEHFDCVEPSLVEAPPNLGNPLNLWSMEEGGGAEVGDDGTSGNVGTINGATWDTGDMAPAPGGSTASLFFDGVDDDVTFVGYQGIGGNQVRTVSAWIKTQSTSVNQSRSIISWGQNAADHKWNFRIQDTNGTDGTIRIEVNSGYVVGSTVVTDGQWHHVAAVYPGGGVEDVQLYVDGQLDALSAINTQPIDTTLDKNVQIGVDHSGRRWLGWIDEVSLYDEALSAAEIQNLYTNQQILGYAAPRSVAESMAALVASNAISTELVMEVSIPNGCEVEVTRTWRVEDCCGDFDLKDEVFSYSLMPTGLVFTSVPEDFDLGCIDNLNQVPPPVPELLQAEAPATTTATVSLALNQFHTIRSNAAGTDTQMRVRGNNPGGTDNRKAYLQFDLSGLPYPITDLVSASLEVTLEANTSGRLVDANVLHAGTPGENWSAGSLAWNDGLGHDPASTTAINGDASYLTTFGPAENMLNQLDVTSAAQTQTSAAGLLTFIFTENLPVQAGGTATFIEEDGSPDAAPRLILNFVSQDAPRCPVSISVGQATELIRNGGFEMGTTLIPADPSGDWTWSNGDLADWTTDADPLPAGANDTAARDANAYSGEFRGYLQGTPVGQVNVNLIQNTGYAMSLGDRFMLCFKERSNTRWDAADSIDVRLFYDDGSARVDLLSTNVVPLNGPKDWASHCFTVEVTDPAAVGQQLQVMFDPAQDTPNANNEIASVDEVSLLLLAANDGGGDTPWGDVIVSNSADGCQRTLQRVYIAEADCGLFAVHTQFITFALNEPVQFDESEALGGDLGCQPAGFIPPPIGFNTGLELTHPLAGATPWLQWNADSYTGGVWTPDISQGRDLDNNNNPVPVPIDEPEAQALTGNGQAVRVGAHGTFEYANDGFASPAGDADTLPSDPPHTISFEACFSPDEYPSAAPQVIWEMGGDNGSGLYLHGHELIVSLNRAADSQGPVDFRYDLRNLAFNPDSDFLCTVLSIDQRVLGLETVRLTMQSSAGLQDQIEFEWANASQFAGTDNGGIGWRAGTAGGTDPNLIDGVDVERFEGRIARVSVYTNVAAALNSRITVEEGIVSSNDCEVIYRRSLVVENCCGDSDRRDVDYRWTPPTDPPVIIGVPVHDLGCINASNNVPLPNPGQFVVQHACGAAVSHVASGSTQQLDLCTYEITHTYIAVDACQQTGTFDQVVRWQVQLVPQIVAVEPSTNFGCQTNGWFPPTNSNALVLANVFLEAPMSASESCASDFAAGGLSNAVVVPGLAGVPVVPEFAWIAEDLAVGDASAATWPGRVLGDDFINGGDPFFNPAGNPQVALIADATEAAFVGSDRAVVLDGTADRFTRGIDLQTDGSPPFGTFPSSYRVCFSPDSLPVTGDQLIVDLGGGTTGNALFLSGSTLSFRMANGSGNGQIDLDLAPLGVTPGSDFICAIASWDQNTQRFHLTAETSAGNFASACQTNLTFGNTFGGNQTGLGGNQGGNASDIGGIDEFAGQISGITFYNGAAAGPDLTDLACNYSEMVGCGAVVMSNDCVTGTVVPAARYETMITACDDLLRWENLEVIVGLPVDGNISVTITDGVNTVNMPLVNGTNAVDLSSFPETSTQLGLRFDLAYAGGTSCETPMIHSWTAHFVCDNLDVLTITNLPIQSNECERTVTRIYRVETCCGNFDRREVQLTWTETPELQVTPLSNLFVGCIDNTNQLPSPSSLLIDASSQCAWVEIEWLGDGQVTNLNTCTDALERVYSVTDVCGSNIVVTQTLSWILRTEPEILTVEQGIDWGCRDITWRPPTNMAAFSAVDATATQVWSEMTTTGCTAFVRHIFRVEGCCGNFDRWDVVHTFTILPTGPFVEAISNTFYGCVDHINQVPEPNITLVNASSSCAVVEIDYIGETNAVDGVCTDSVDRIYEVTDLCGQTTQITQTVSWILNDPADNPMVLEVETGQFWGCQTNGWTVPPTNVFVATNYAGSIVTSEVYSTNLESCVATLERTYTVADCCGDEASATVVHTWRVLQESPVLTGEPVIDLGCLADANQVPLPDPGVLMLTAACGADVTWTSLTAVVTTQACGYVQTNIFTATDACSQSASFTQVWTWIIDNQDPKFVYLPGGHNGCTPPPSAGQDAAEIIISDNCVTQLMFLGETQTVDGCEVTVTRNWMAMDACQNSEVAQTVWTWTQTPASPTLTGPPQIDAGCIASTNEIPLPNTGILTASVSCGVVQLIHLGDGPHNPLDLCEIGFIREYVLEDACDTFASFTQLVTYTIETGAQITNHPATTNFGCDIPVFPTAADVQTDPPGLPVTIAQDQFVTNLDCSVTLTRTFQVEDCCGNIDRKDSVVEWIPRPVPPLVMGVTNIALGCIPDAGQVPLANPGQFMVTAACGVEVKFLSEIALPQADCSFGFLRTYRATDLCGGTNDFQQTLTWTIEETPEVVGIEAGGYLGCSDGLPTNLPPAASTFWDIQWPRGAFVSTNLATNGCTITLTRTYRVENCCGLFHERSVDHSWTAPAGPPAIFGLTNIALGCISSEGLIPVPNTSQFTLDATCGGTMGWLRDGPLTTNGCVYSFVRTYAATNFCGLTSTFDQAISYSLYDDPLSLLAIESDQIFSCSTTNPVPEPDYTQMEVVGHVVTQGVTEITVTNGCDRRMIRTYWVEDCCQNRDDMSVTFTWTEDGEAPTITTNATWQPVINAGCNPQIGDVPGVDLSQFEVSDNCGAQIYYGGDSQSTNGCTATVARVYYAEDACGNRSSITQQFIFLLDHIAPEPTIMPSHLWLGCNPTDIPGPELTVFAVENTCGTPLSTQVVDETSREVDCEIWITRTYRITDQCGNVGEAQQILRYVADTEPPILVAKPDDRTLGCNESIPDPDVTAVRGFDACGDVSVRLLGSDLLPGVGCVETVQHRYELMDACSNAVATTVTYTRVVDSAPPILSCPTGIVIQADANCFAPMPLLPMMGSDVCGAVSQSQSLPSGLQLPGPDVYTAQVVVVDNCGHSATCQVPVTVLADCGPGEPPPAGILIEKSVYLGHDGGVGCGVAGETVISTNGAEVTYCFRIRNVGQVPLYAIELRDLDLTPAVSDVVADLLPTGASVAVYVERLINGPLTNTATAIGYPEDSQEPVADSDTASVSAVMPGLWFNKTVSLDGICPGVERVEGFENTPTTFCFSFANVGDVPLRNLHLTDPALGIDLGLVVQLDPGQSNTYQAASAIQASYTNTAWIYGTPLIDGTEQGRVVASNMAAVVLTPAPPPPPANSIISGIVWEDPDLNGIVDEVTNTLGITGVDVRLYEVEAGISNLLETIASGPGGAYAFTDLEAGNYSVVVERSQVETRLELDSTPLQYGIILGPDEHAMSNNFGFAERPTAVKLTAFDAILLDEGVVISWSWGRQSDVLGFRIRKEGEAVSDLIPARRGLDTLMHLDRDAVGGTYQLEAVGTDLTSEILGITTTRAEAKPEGEVGTTVIAENGRAEFITEGETQNYLVYEFDSEPEIRDLTSDRILIGESLQVEGRQGVYFRAAPGLQIRVRE